MHIRLWLLAFLVLIAATLLVQSAPKGGRGGGGRGGGSKKKEEATDVETVPEGEVEPEPEPKGKGKKKDLNEVRERLKKKGPKNRKQRPEGFGKPGKKRLSKEQKDKVKAACGKKRGGCKGQPDKQKERKRKTKDRVLKSRVRRLKGSKNTTEQRQKEEEKVQREVQKTFDAKKAVMAAQGITPEDEIEPYDNGVWQNDMVLTEEQAAKIIELASREQTDADNPPELPGGDAKKRRKRFALHIEDNLGAKFDVMPIPVYIPGEDMFGFSAEEKQIILNALKDIQDKSCVSFEEVNEIPESAAHIYFEKDDYQEVCATGNIGRVGVQNTIWLSFAEECQEQIFGSIIHQTMHALGVDHQHIRYDRNSNVYIDYDNLDPQLLEFYQEGDSDAFTSYGLPYDYFSVMHFGAYTGALDSSRPTMQAVQEPKDFFTEVMGQRRGLSDRDAALISKMYCRPDCDDVQVWCGWWSTVGYCTEHTMTMVEYCPKSCGFCPNSANLEALEKVAAKEAASDAFFFFKK